MTRTVLPLAALGDLASAGVSFWCESTSLAEPTVHGTWLLSAIFGTVVLAFHFAGRITLWAENDEPSLLGDEHA